MKLLGTINGRIDVGLEGVDDLFIHASSNKIIFSMDEMKCLLRIFMAVFDCDYNYEEIVIRLNKRSIPLFAPAPPPATMTL